MRLSPARIVGSLSIALLVSAAPPASATETENLGVRVLPAPGKIVVDGKFDDWDLSGGIFVCGDVETARDKLAGWFHLMYDADNLYVMHRWVDSTPLNNPGVVAGDMGFQGDCLQVRIVTFPAAASERTAHLTAWRGRDGKDVIDVVYGKKFDGGHVKDGRTIGMRQAFAVDADGKGYVQEMAIPWKLIVAEGDAAPKAGDTLRVAVEPNYTVGVNGRISYKDVFQPNVTLDRVFTFMSSQQWGTATLEAKGNVPPAPVRLSDRREFAVRLEKGVPAVDWTGVIKSRELLGFKDVAVTMPEDGYVSLNLRGPDGTVARQLLNATFLTKGPHTVKWDGLTSPNWRKPGEPVAAGTYTWDAIYHTGIGLKLKGWAANGGITPWDAPAGKGNWGGDHGVPSGVAVDADKVYLGWTAAEAGKALLACNLDGEVQWNNTHGGIAGASRMAVDGKTVYVIREGEGHGARRATIYRVTTADGSYTNWAGSDSTDLEVPAPHTIEARAGRLYLTYPAADKITVLDGATGKEIKTIALKSPTAIRATADETALVVSGGSEVLSVDLASGQSKAVVSNLTAATAVAADKAGRIYVGVRDPDNQVKVFDAAGKAVGAIGRTGGRALLGPWQADGMRFVNDIAVDARGQLWAMEADTAPKRVSVWDPATGKLVREFFGPTSYGALGGAINPNDPNLMVGQGCEWRLDPKTGRASCVGVITREAMENARFATGPGGRTYLLSAQGWAFAAQPVRVFERLGDADYRLRAMFSYTKTHTTYWSDEDGDGKEQPAEVQTVPGVVQFSGWFMNVTPDFTLYANGNQYKTTGFTACGAPKYDLAKPAKLPAKGLGTADGKFLLTTGEYNTDHSWMDCFDLGSGKKVWRYADTFVGVHGSHNAPGPEVGLVRGSFGPAGTATLPAPIGNVWVLATNVGEWHIVTERGFYLTRLFQPDPLAVQFPERAVPGSSLDNCPPGMGGEDFGGSITLAGDGKLYVQAGKTAFWNAEVTGLESVRAIAGATVTITDEDVKRAAQFRDRYLQETVGRQQLAAARMTPKFTGNLDADFKGAKAVAYKKQEESAARSAVAWDEQNLYVAWDVRDASPWVNGAAEAEMMYLGGDTVDLQLGADAKADANRGEAVAGDLRVSIGNFKGKPTAVLYRKVAAEKRPRTFDSGVIKGYVMESVAVLGEANVVVKSRDKGYVVEAAIPLAALGLKPGVGQTIRGDLGVTFGDPAGRRTRLRSYWNNQHTGIVDDAVFELRMEPKNWGEIKFE